MSSSDDRNTFDVLHEQQALALLNGYHINKGTWTGSEQQHALDMIQLVGGRGLRNQIERDLYSGDIPAPTSPEWPAYYAKTWADLMAEYSTVRQCTPPAEARDLIPSWVVPHHTTHDQEQGAEQ